MTGLPPDLTKSTSNPLSFFTGSKVAVGVATTISVSPISSDSNSNSVNLVEVAEPIRREETDEIDIMPGAREDEIEEEEDHPPPDSKIVDIDIDWNSEENWQRRLWKRIIDERRMREEQIQLIDQKTCELNKEKQNLAQIRYNIDKRNHDLEIRESRLVEIDMTIPLARQFQEMKIDIANFLPWSETIQEYAMNHNTDLTTGSF